MGARPSGKEREKKTEMASWRGASATIAVVSAIMLWVVDAADSKSETHARGELWRIKEGAKLIGDEAKIQKPAKHPCAAHHDCATCQGATETSCKWCAPNAGNATSHFHCAATCEPGSTDAGCSTVDFVMTLIFIAVLICGLPVACCCVFFMCPRPHLAATDYTYEAIEVMEGPVQGDASKQV